MSRLTRSTVVALALGLAGGAAVPAASSAAPTSCPKHKNELVRSAGGVLWTSNGKSKPGNLYVCTAYYGDPPVSKKIGPWTKQSRLAFNGSTVVWTVRKKDSAGDPIDAVYAADGPYGNWLNNVRPTVGPGNALDQRVSRLAVYGDAAAWVTTKGTVMLGVPSPNGAEAEPVGAGTPGAAAPVVPGVTDVPLTADNLLAYKQGLATAPLKPTGRRLLVGRWTALAGPVFADTLELKEGPDGDGDECGGVSSYKVTVQPVAGEARVGATWWSDWSSTSLACTS